MQGTRDWCDALVAVEKTPLKRQFPNLGKTGLPDLILKCVMVQCDETAALPSPSPDHAAIKLGRTSSYSEAGK